MLLFLFNLGFPYGINRKIFTMYFQLEQQVEAEELSNSILIEISKASVTKWQEKLNNRFDLNFSKDILFFLQIWLA